MPFEDELPDVPQPATQPEATFDDSIDASAFEGVGKLGDCMPKGTFHFRLDSYKKGMSKEENISAEDKAKGKKSEPQYALTWKCQEEPFTGRMMFDNIPWVSDEDKKGAAAGDPGAKQKLSERLVRANSLMQAAGFKPTGNFGFADFLATNPEVKLTLGQSEIKEKDSAGKYTKGTGEFRNNVVKYVSLSRPK